MTLVGWMAFPVFEATAAQGFFSRDGKTVTLIHGNKLGQVDIASGRYQAIPLPAEFGDASMVSVASGAPGETWLLTNEAVWVMKDGADQQQVSNVTTVQTLLDVGADPKTLDIHGISPLAHAAAAGKTASMAALLTNGAAPDATRPNEKPPVWVAASAGQLRAVRFLLAAGADPDALNPQTNTTALEVAKSRGDQPMVTLLENHPRNK